MDVYTEENRAFHTLIRNSHPGKGTGRRLSLEEIREVRQRSKTESFEEIYKDFKEKVSRDSLKKIYNNQTYKAI